MSWRTNLTDLSEGDKRRFIPFRNAAIAFSIIYPATIVIALWLVPDDHPTVAERLLMLLPVAPCLYFANATRRWLAGQDDYVKLIHYRGMATGFGVAVITAVTMGFLTLPGGSSILNRITPWAVAVIALVAWGVSAGVGAVREA